MKLFPYPRIFFLIKKIETVDEGRGDFVKVAVLTFGIFELRKNLGR